MGLSAVQEPSRMARSAGPFALEARAKLNLWLAVGAVQADGLHEVRSVMADLLLADEVEFVPARGAFGVDCEAAAATDDAAALPERSNLAWRAVMALRPELRGWRIRLRKRIPSQAGLGGGSADAAAALRGCARIIERLGIPVAEARLRMIAPVLGSDVSACLIPGLKIVRATGAQVKAVAAATPPWGVLLLKPAERVSTSAAYRLLDESRGGAQTTIADDGAEEVAAAFAAGDFARVTAGLRNDFQAVVESALPGVREARERVMNAGAPAALLCGSGSCVAGLFASKDDAEAASRALTVGPGEWSTVTGFADAG